jgi:glutamate-1-semialdehyde 2,1-aminomutase
MAAGLEMLQALNKDEAIFKRLAEKTAYLHEGMSKVLSDAHVAHTINRVGSMISVHFTETPIVDFETAAEGNNDTFKKFFHGMLKEGVYIAPSAFETWFITDALSYQDLDDTIQAVKTVAETL